VIPGLEVTTERDERFSQFPSGAFLQGAFINLVNWVMNGVSPPYAPPIEISGSKIVGDEFANARGGVRSPYVDIPTRRYIVSRYVTGLIGVEIPLSSEQLRRLYGSQEGYLKRFDEGIDALVEGRWITCGDGDLLKREEAEQVLF
jgi:Alpha/beta hydrolase domain